MGEKKELLGLGEWKLTNLKGDYIFMRSEGKATVVRGLVQKRVFLVDTQELIITMIPLLILHLVSYQQLLTPLPLKIMALRLCSPLRLSFTPSINGRISLRGLRCSAEKQQNLQSLDTRKLVLEIKEKLGRENPDLPVGKNGRDDEDMIFWFLKDRKFSVEDAVRKLAKAIKWREDFGVSELSVESVKSMYGTGKAYVHDFLDINGRPVLVVVSSKHFPAKHDARENEKLCVFLIEKALSKLPYGTEEILGVIDLRGFRTENGDVLFLKFLFDVFYYYYPKRLGQVLFVDAPFVFQPIWQLVKPLLKSYTSLVRFCNADTVRKEYFTEDTVPADFKD